MANTFVIACPDCAKQVKVSDEHVGKRIKCKGCGTIFPVKAADGSPPSPSKAAPPSAPKTKTAAPAAPKTSMAAPPEPSKPRDDEYDPNDYSLTATNDNLPRCPFCASEMESAEALICLTCGYNTRTRTRPEVKKIYQPTGFEVFLWLLPAILASSSRSGCSSGIWFSAT